MENHDTLTAMEAYMAMVNFLEEHWRQTNSDDVASLLSSLNLLPDGMPLDRAMWDEWVEAIQKARAGLGGSEYFKC